MQQTNEERKSNDLKLGCSLIWKAILIGTYLFTITTLQMYSFIEIHVNFESENFPTENIHNFIQLLSWVRWIIFGSYLFLFFIGIILFCFSFISF